MLNEIGMGKKNFPLNGLPEYAGAKRSIVLTPNRPVIFGEKTLLIPAPPEIINTDDVDCVVLMTPVPGVVN